MKRKIPTLQKNDLTDPLIADCGHGFKIAECPFLYCASRAMLEALIRIDRQAMSLHPIGHDAIMAIRAALRLAGQKPAPEYKPTAKGGSVLTAAIREKLQNPNYRPTKEEARALALDAVLFGRRPE